MHDLFLGIACNRACIKNTANCALLTLKGLKKKKICNIFKERKIFGTPKQFFFCLLNTWKKYSDSRWQYTFIVLAMNVFAIFVVYVQVDAHVHAYVCGWTHALEEGMELTWLSQRERPQSSNSLWDRRAKCLDMCSFLSQLH